MNYNIPVSQPDLSEIERQYLLKAFDSGWISSTGEFTNLFENRWATECDSQFSLGVSNGTVALHLILKALEIGPGDEVIVPSLTFIATANAVTYVGATVVFADSDLYTWNIDIQHVERLITPKTKAIIGVHLYGNPCDIEKLKNLCDAHNIHLIEDAAEAPFATVNGQKTGSFGVASSFSFYGNKILTCGEGGAITTSNLDLYERMKLLRGQGMHPTQRYYFTEIGFNYRLTNLQYAVLNGQLDRKLQILNDRMRIFNQYKILLREISIINYQHVLPNNTFSPWLFTIVFENSNKDLRTKVVQNLALKGIETRPMFIPIHLLPAYSAYNSLELRNATKLAKNGLSLPTWSKLSNKQIEFIVETVKEGIK